MGHLTNNNNKKKDDDVVENCFFIFMYLFIVLQKITNFEKNTNMKDEEKKFEKEPKSSAVDLCCSSHRLICAVLSTTVKV